MKSGNKQNIILFDFDMKQTQTTDNETFILVVVEQTLKFAVKYFQVFLDENLLTHFGQLVLSTFMQVNTDTSLLLQQPCLCLEKKSAQKSCNVLTGLHVRVVSIVVECT